ncbi:MAG: carboxylating nicotinate-nucleotide diphosphorylase [Bacteroidota bacterium]
MTIDQLVELAIAEDKGTGDHTSLACIPQGKQNKALLLVKEPGIIAGLDVAVEIFKKIDSGLKTELYKKDGDVVVKGDIAFFVEGNAHSILLAERLVLNIMQRMSGIATITNKVVKQLDGLKTKVLDTRKTTPLLRALEKKAVKIGGGENHRMGLYDMILIKDNHIDYAGGMANAIDAAVNYLEKNSLHLEIEVETRSLEEVKMVLDKGNIHRIMLDNFSFDDLKKAVQMINGKYETEASGGITPENARSYAETGVDFISLGALTHSVKSIDLSLKAC